MGKILSLLVIAALAYLVFRGVFRSGVRDAEGGGRARAKSGEDMVACVRCGVNLPRSSAREVRGGWVCEGNPDCR